MCGSLAPVHRHRDTAERAHSAAGFANEKSGTSASMAALAPACGRRCPTGGEDARLDAEASTRCRGLYIRAVECVIMCEPQGQSLCWPLHPIMASFLVCFCMPQSRCIYPNVGLEAKRLPVACRPVNPMVRPLARCVFQVYSLRHVMALMTLTRPHAPSPC